jgi:hypothetical protein
MLKNKKAIYILIPLNLFIWGFFAYRIYSAFGEEKQVKVSGSEHLIVKKSLNSNKEKHRFDLSYDDPFLKAESKQKYPKALNHQMAVKTGFNSKEQLSGPSVISKSESKKPEIKYMGLIKNSSTGIAHAIISLNGQSLIVKKGQVSDGITFKQITKDSLVAKWGKELVVIKK